MLPHVGQATVSPDKYGGHCSHSVAEEFARTCCNTEVFVCTAYLMILNNRKRNRRTWIRQEKHSNLSKELVLSSTTLRNR